MRVVIDTSAFFYGFRPEGSNEYFTTESVLDEIRGRRMREGIENFINLVTVMKPSERSISDVMRKAAETGDSYQLSRTDVELIALALESGATLLTNDLSVQNVCRRIGVEYQSFMGKSIKYDIVWKYRCPACGRRYDRKMEDCPHCGNKLKRYPVRKKVIV
jgi:UPF0271 protein